MEIWRSAFWFPFSVAGAVLAAAWGAERLGSAESRAHTRGDVVAGAGVVLALYATTAAMRGEPETVSVVLTSAIALAVWAWWDPSPRSFLVGSLGAVSGPLAEIGVVAADASHYAEDSDGLFGVAPWLPALYFAAGAVASGLWPALRRGERA